MGLRLVRHSGISDGQIAKQRNTTDTETKGREGKIGGIIRDDG